MLSAVIAPGCTGQSYLHHLATAWGLRLGAKLTPRVDHAFAAAHRTPIDSPLYRSGPTATYLQETKDASGAAPYMLDTFGASAPTKTSWSANRQCVVAVRPSSSPPAERRRAPVRMDAVRRPRASIAPHGVQQGVVLDEGIHGTRSRAVPAAGPAFRNRRSFPRPGVDVRAARSSYW
ncbi:MAG: hypothetical protein HOY79_26220 [Streptomyces sp.]|nr:hypothetical protein [Streptomyces sp.]